MKKILLLISAIFLLCAGYLFLDSTVRVYEDGSWSGPRGSSGCISFMVCDDAAELLDAAESGSLDALEIPVSDKVARLVAPDYPGPGLLCRHDLGICLVVDREYFEFEYVPGNIEVVCDQDGSNIHCYPEHLGKEWTCHTFEPRCWK